jgi:hypothetical protein
MPAGIGDGRLGDGNAVAYPGPPPDSEDQDQGEREQRKPKLLLRSSGMTLTRSEART